MKISSLKQLIELGYDAYVVCQKENYKHLTIPTGLKGDVVYFDSMKKETNEFLEKLNQLNVKIYGPKSMPAPKWVFAHNIEVAGASIGFMKDGEPISCVNFIPQLDTKKIEVWTFMMTFDILAGLGFGKLNFALLMELNQNKDWVTYITQMDNEAAVKMYLHAPNPTILDGIGFYHTHDNSVLLKTKIAKNPFETCTGTLEMADPSKLGYISDTKKPELGREYLVKQSQKDALYSLIQSYGCHITGWHALDEPTLAIKIFKKGHYDN